MLKRLCLLFCTLTCIASVKANELKGFKLVPSLTSCSIYLDITSVPNSHQTEYKKSGSESWKTAYPLVVSPDKNQLRGSIVNLSEDTFYDIRLTVDGSQVYQAKTKTWSSHVPIAKTINIKDIANDDGIIIDAKGTADGWIKYTSDDNYILKGNGDSNAVITLKNAQYIILENLTIVGGKRHGISLEKSQHIRVINCDISGFGRIGKQDLMKDGKYYMPNGRAVNYDAGINIANSGNLVIERNYIHDPRNRANAWKFSHPAGPNAIAVISTGNVVVRYNDFIGSDEHRWNDCIEGHANGYMRGSFHRDSDIYGNMMAFGNDDGIELDGGQINIRVFENKFEGFLCGVSTAPCLGGPSYIFKNLIVNLGDEDGMANCAFKNGHGNYGKGQIFFFNNTVYTQIGRGYGNYGGKKFSPNPYDKMLKGTTRNNLLYCPAGHFNIDYNLRRKNDFDYDLIYSDQMEPMIDVKHPLSLKGLEKHGIFLKNPHLENTKAAIFKLKASSPAIDSGDNVPNFVTDFTGKKSDIGACEFSTKPMNLPYRPLPVYLDKYQLNFTVNSGKLGEAQTVKASVPVDSNFSSAFKIRKNNVFDWFSVEPAEGLLKAGDTLAFNVKIIDNGRLNPGLKRGAFLVRMANGLSRVVTVYAKVKGNKNLIKPGKGFVQLIEAEQAKDELKFPVVEDANASGKKALHFKPEKLRQFTDKSQTYHFEVPKDGHYMIFVRVKSDIPVGNHDSVFASLDDCKPQAAHLRSATDWRWANVSINPKNRNFQLHNLKKGKHQLKLYGREAIYVDTILITDNLEKVY